MRESWIAIITQYPDRWIALRNPEMDGPDILSGEVVAVISDDDIIEFEDEHVGEGLIYRRTTDGELNGLIRANFVIETA